MKGLVRFARAFPMTAAMQSFGGSANAQRPSLLASHQLDRDEDQEHPGEGSA